MNPCTVDSCDKPRHRGSKLCGMHRTRLYRHGTTAPTRVRKTCSVTSCETPAHGKGLCETHYRRLQRAGDPLAPDRCPARAPAELNSKWQGADITYGAAHKRARTKHGSASLHSCVDCGVQAAHWSYNHDDHDELIDDKGRRFSPDPEHYSPRCVPCHRAFDLGLTHAVA